jgi:MFS transporter, PAT family, beta-lactamase induction signal transducer AmpG
MPLRSLILLLFLGFASGLPLALTASTLSVWLDEAGVNMKTIGVFASLATPYALKFLWAPLIDGVRIPVFCRMFGRRRGWVVAAQLCLMASLVAMSLQSPSEALLPLAIAAFCVAFFSATQDIVLDALRIEMLKNEDQGLGAATFVFGYRVGMIAATAGALVLSVHVGWAATYQVMAALLLLGVAATLFAPEPEDAAPKTLLPWRKWLREFVWQPFAEFLKRSGALWILAFIIFYKLTDAFLGMMTMPYLRAQGFTKTDIAEIVKLFGLIATIAGGFVGGFAVKRVGIMRMLTLGLFLQAATNLLYILLIAQYGDKTWLTPIIFAENFAGGIGTTAFVAYLSGLVNREFTATQYALLNSFASFGRTWLSAPSGVVAQSFGWPIFFLVSACFALPAYFLLRKLPRVGYNDR